MNTSGNTVLITGGTGGIGFELAKQLLALRNTVIITGRDASRLEKAKAQLPGVRTIQSDASDRAAIQALYERVTREFPAVNVLINNAGTMRRRNLQDGSTDLEELTSEVEVNLNGPIRLSKIFLSHFKSKENAAIVNVSSGLAFVPLPISPVYCATKAGLHSFTMSLRAQLKNTKVQVFELAPPATQTELLSQFDAADLAGTPLMDVSAMVREAIEGLAKDQLEIRPGRSNLLKLMSRIAPEFIFKQLSKSVERMWAEGRR